MTQEHIPDISASNERGCLARVLCITCAKHLRDELLRLGVSQTQAAETEQASQNFALKLEGLGDADVYSLKAALEARGMSLLSDESASNGSSCIIWGSKAGLESTSSGRGGLEPRTAVVMERCRAVLADYLRTDFKLAYPGGQIDLTGRTAVMGVVNVTPDSFSDGGDFCSAESATEHALSLVEAGADIIDVGGESTRPGSEPVGLAEELERVIPVIEAVTTKASVPVSVDTYKPEVARAALEAGAKMVNDVNGLRDNCGMAEVVAEKQVPVILMHMKGSPRTMQKNPVYHDLISEICSGLSSSMEVAVNAGIPRDRIAIDPGIGFGKTVEDNLVILDRLHEFRSLGVPICIGVSRKSFLGATLGIAEPKRRLVGSLAANVIAVREGARIVRVHDVQEAVEAIRVADAVAAGGLASEA